MKKAKEQGKPFVDRAAVITDEQSEEITGALIEGMACSCRAYVFDVTDVPRLDKHAI